MGIGWLLFIKSFKQSWRRLALVVVAVALGVTLLITFAAALNGLNARSSHNDWRSQLFTSAQTPQAQVAGISPLVAATWIPGNLNKWQNETIWTTSLYATGENSPKLPGIGTPKPGEYYVSPALDKIIRTHPDSDLGKRFGDKQIGILSENYVTSPDSLDVIRGMTKEESETNFDGNEYPRIYALSEHAQAVNKYSGIVTYVMLLGIIILLFPVVLFISIAVQLGSAQREQRYAALRLIGATQSQINRIIGVESLTAALAGIVIGSLMSLLARLWLLEFKFDGMRFWPDDITVYTSQYLLIAGVTLAMALVANWWGMRHVQTTPLGIARRSLLEKLPRWWRGLPLAAGVGVFVAANATTQKDQGSTQTLILLIGGVLLIMFGLVVGGAWITNLLSSIAAKRAKQAHVLLGAKRIAAHPKQIFRSVSGVVVALYAGSFYLTAVSGMGLYELNSIKNNGYSTIKDNAVFISASKLPVNFSQTLKQQPYISSVAEIQRVDYAISVMPCPTLPVYTTRECPSDKVSQYVALNLDAPTAERVGYGSTATQAVQNAGFELQDSTATAFDTGYFVTMNSNSHIDQLRSLVATNSRGIMTDTMYVVSGTYATLPATTPLIRELSGLTYAGIVVTMFIAVGSLAVSTVGGLLERRRSLLTLHMGGMTIRQLKTMVIIESLFPLVMTSIIAAAAGVGSGYLFMQMVSAELDAMLSPLYCVVVIGSLAASALAIYLILPIIGPLTSLEANRTE